MAITTQGVLLTISNGSTIKNVDIKSFPDLGAAPNMIECTTLSDSVQKFVEGVTPMAAIEFTANYDSTLFGELKGMENQQNTYSVTFGNNGANGSFEWTGSHTAIVAGGGVNAVLDMRLSVLPDSEIA